MRSTHSVHFFITPSTSEYSRAPYGQAHEHNLQPMHLSSSTSTIPSEARLYDAPVGHTETQAGVSQCRHERGKCSVDAGCPSPAATSYECTRLNHTPKGSAPYGSSSVSGPATPPEFHSLQATAQAWQPTQVSRSITRPSFFAEGGGNIVMLSP